MEIYCLPSGWKPGLGENLKATVMWWSPVSLALWGALIYGLWTLLR
jgi:hypothetical protein